MNRRRRHARLAASVRLAWPWSGQSSAVWPDWVAGHRPCSTSCWGCWAPRSWTCWCDTAGRGVLVQLAVLAVVGVASAGLARMTARPNAAVAFEQAFGAPPPAGVTLLSAKRRWFDGQITAFRFRADASAIAAAVARRPFISG